MENNSPRSPCYKSSDIPSFDIGTIMADVVDFTIERATSIDESKRVYFSQIRLHSIIKYPDEMKGALLEASIIKSEDPGHVAHIDKNHVGVGLFAFYEPTLPEQYLSTPNGFFNLQVAFSNEEFELIANMLQQYQINSLCKLNLSAEVAGIRPKCEWDSAGILCATRVAVTSSVKGGNEN